MYIYIFSALITYFLLFFSKKVKNSYLKNILILLSFCVLFFVSAFRVNVGTDYKSYVSWFNEVLSFPRNFTNFSFNLCIYIIKLFTLNHQYLFIVTSFIILFFIYYTIVNRYKEYDMIIFLFVVLGYYFSTFNGIRQWIAISIFMYSYKYIIEEKILKYVLCILFASTFHITALLLLPCYFFINIKTSDKVKLIILLLSLIIFKLFDFNNLLALILKTFSQTFYYRYIVSGVNLSRGVGSSLPIILNCGMFLYYIIFKDKFKNKENHELNKNLCFIVSFFSILNTTNNLFSRFSLYFIPMTIMFLPDFYEIYEKKIKTLFKVSIIVFGIIFMTVNTTLKNSNNPLPYRSIFDEVTTK